MKNKRILIASVLAVGAMAMAGSAFTDSNTMPPDAVEGFGQQTISGVVVTSVAYNLDSSRTAVESVTVVVEHSVELDLFVAFNTDDPAACTSATLPVVNDPVGSSTYTCDLVQNVVDITNFKLSASGLHEA